MCVLGYSFASIYGNSYGCCRSCYYLCTDKSNASGNTAKQEKKKAKPSYMLGSHGEVPTGFPTSTPTAYHDFVAGFFDPPASMKMKPVATPAPTPAAHGW
jgi:hypothetical protein